KKHVSLTHSASAVLIDNVLYYLSVLLMILAGVGGYVYYFQSSNNAADSGVLWALAISAVLIIAAFALAIYFRVTPVSRIIKVLAERGIAPKFLLKMQDGVLNVETNLFQFYYLRRTDFLILFGISSLVHIVSAFEVYLALKLLGFDVLWSTAFIIEGLTKIINVIFSFVPGNIGVYEGGNSVILLSLGYTGVVGVALAIVRRVAIMFSLFVGLVILLWKAVERGTKTLVESAD
ncbi:MAG TPA: lysylphosphatidylglycerol synthase domain-containing protein, partial [Pyrinomonadaceae bacterium]|nr:lysylphosphatidylglycerol synthase domain-containing protein [Pyrinomonadaceae bacterium]